MTFIVLPICGEAIPLLPFLTFTGIYFLVCYASLAAWAVLGDRISAYLNTPLPLRLFNGTMGGLLIATACYLGRVVN